MKPTSVGHSKFSHFSYPLHDGESDMQITNYLAIPKPLKFHQVIGPHPPGRGPH